MNIAAKTHVGYKRVVNEDSVYISSGELPCLAIVADGMGGHNAGEVASRDAVACIQRALGKKTLEQITAQDVRQALEQANEYVMNKALSSERLSQMGTTVTMAIVTHAHLLIGQVGDSSGLLVRDGKLEKITKDHSYVQELVDSGSITQEQAKYHPYKNVITSAIGMSNPQIDIYERDFCPGDILILCSDGLTNMVEDEELVHSCQQHPEDMEILAQELVECALSHGGTDNITLVAVSNTSKESGCGALIDASDSGQEVQP